jgi:hypothetical protein
LRMHKLPFIAVGLEHVPAIASIRVEMVHDRLELPAELIPRRYVSTPVTQ